MPQVFSTETDLESHVFEKFERVEYDLTRHFSGLASPGLWNGNPVKYWANVTSGCSRLHETLKIQFFLIFICFF